MAQFERDKTERMVAGAPPRIRVARREDGSIDLTPAQRPEDVRPETVAEEKPQRGDDPRPRDGGGPPRG